MYLKRIRMLYYKATMVLTLVTNSNPNAFTNIFLIRNVTVLPYYSDKVIYLNTAQLLFNLTLLHLEPQHYSRLKYGTLSCVFYKFANEQGVVISGTKIQALPVSAAGVIYSTVVDPIIGSKLGVNVIFEMLLVYFPTSFVSVSTSKLQANTLTVFRSSLRLVISFLKNHWTSRALILIDLWATDFPSRLERFEVNYLLMTTKVSFRLNLRVFTDEWLGLPSVTDVYNSADWLEREVWDMYGVYFYGHRCMRRILTDYGFWGHPLRKDFPVTGYFEVRYDNNVQRVVLESLNLVQELRLFNFDAPWKRNLPNLF